MGRLAKIALGLVVIGAAGAAGTGWWANRWYHQPGPLAADKTVVLPRKIGTEEIGRRLAEAGLLDKPSLFVVAAKLTSGDGELKAGEYEFPAAISPDGILDELRAGKTVVHRLTVPEGLTSAEVVALIKAAPFLDGEITTVPGEGQLLPSTYFYSLGDKRETLLDGMHRQMEKVLSGLWARRRGDLQLGTQEEALTLASVVEKETGVAAERPLIAGVFYNRLRLGMKLQSDPTVVYALTHGQGPLDRPLSKADLQVQSPYNTYAVKGLPPAPIANPGRAALQAVLAPASTNALYFVADGTGGHTFSENLNDHNRAVQQLRQQEAIAAPHAPAAPSATTPSAPASNTPLAPNLAPAPASAH